MKNFLIIAAAIISLGYVILYWDYHLSKYLFTYYCEEEGRVGLFVYEKVALPDEYFMPFPEDKDPRDLDSRFIIGDNKMINKKRFEQDYIFNVYQHKPLSRFGPIESVETSVVRKSDKKTLGKAVSLLNNLGDWINTSKFGNKTEKCPTGKTKDGKSDYRRDHKELIKQIFN